MLGGRRQGSALLESPRRRTLLYVAREFTRRASAHERRDIHMPNSIQKATACGKKAASKKAQSGASPKAARSKPLDSELELLRDSLAHAHQALKSNSEDMAKSGMLVVRLTDSVAKALLAQQKLLAGSDGASSPEAEFDNTLRAMGLGEL